MTKQVEGKWVKVKFSDEEYDVQVRSVPNKVLNQIRKRHTKEQFKRGQATENIDYIAIHEERVNYAIVDWKDIQDEDGKPFKCTKDNKKLLVDNNPGFISEVMEVVDNLAEEIQNISEAETKN